MTTANNTKATKVTLNSIVFAAAPALRELKEGETHTKTELKQFEKDMNEHISAQSVDLARYLVNKTDNTDTIARLLVAAAEAIPSVLKEMAEERQKQEAAREAERLAAEEEKRKQQELEQKELEEKKETMLKLLVENAGIDLEVAKAMVAAGAKNLAPSSAKNSYDRVSCTIDGAQYDVPVRGNMSQALKDLAAKYGFADNREGFIEKFRDEPAKAEAANDTAEA